MVDRIKTILLVSLVTVFIWVFAESESLTSRAVRVEIAFDPDSAGDRAVDVTDPNWHDHADVTIEGPTGTISDAESALRRPIRLHPGMPGVPSAPGEAAADLALAIRQLPDLQGKPVSITRADPPTVRLRIDQLVSREVKVAVDAPGAELDGPAESRPATVRLTVPEAAAGRLTESSTATARVSPDTLRQLVPGRKETVSNVAVDPPAEAAGPRARLDPARVEVALTLRSRTATYTLASVPVYVHVAAVEYDRWDIQVAPEDQFLTDVQVTGPSDAVDQVRRGEIRITANVDLSFDELERAITSKEVSFSQVPTPLAFKSDNTRVRLAIRKREPAPRQ